MNASKQEFKKKVFKNSFNYKLIKTVYLMISLRGGYEKNNNK